MSHSTEALVIALVRRAARNAPSALSARLEEEWLADAQERTSNLSRLRFAAGCYWASIAIGLEHRPASVPAAGAAHGNTASIVLEPPRFLSSRAVTFGLVLSLHAAVFCGLMLGGPHISNRLSRRLSSPGSSSGRCRRSNRPRRALTTRLSIGEFRRLSFRPM